MTAHVGTLSVDGTPISRTDLARIQAEDALHAEQQRRAVLLVAQTATDVEDCRTLLAMLGLEHEVVTAARSHVASAPTKRPRKHRAA